MSHTSPLDVTARGAATTGRVDREATDVTARAARITRRIDYELFVAANWLRVVTPDTRVHVTRRLDRLLDRRLAASVPAGSIRDADGTEWSAGDLGVAAERGAAWLARQVLPALDPSDPRAAA